MKKVLIIGSVWPEPSTTAAGHRMQQLLNSFLNFGWVTTFASTAARTHFSLDLEKIGVRTVPIQLNHSSFDDFIRELDPNIVVFDRFMVEEQFGWRVADNLPDAVRILNTEDLHSLRKTREECHKKGEKFTLGQWKSNDMTKREIASIYRSDLSLMVSTFEMELLLERLKLPKEIVMHLPFMLDEIMDESTISWPSFQDRTGFITYGNGKHTPNVDSIWYLNQKIWPLIRNELPEVTLKVFGAYLPQHIEQLHKPKEGFHVLGWAENLDAEIQSSRVCLAPIRFGAGIKGKLIQSMQNGTPSVTTNIGAEGMNDESDWPGKIQDDPLEFAESAIELYTNRKIWERAQMRGMELINQNYCKHSLEKRLKSKLEHIALNLVTHRSQNFIGQLLQQQTIASTRFMGKWIEEKNKTKTDG
ncbi:glycosyltransferase [Flagellimonas allohymeniacidonis]|uniref:Glycosyltransferase n=1 Tax=Flagellimonas allohymeniacidonis TaxID=2517819 RepID=A0A4Q8QFW5_9FLAO|nr:glycosyltransferase [Allomuricauda hymeniacidonis]TAI48774.1 glycosyltransferase [Allomuricauda hymeniacidonis]